MSVRIPAIKVLLLPKDTNAHGTIFGGVILSHIDLASAIEARTVAAHRYVTKAMREVEFHEPVFVGDIVCFYTEIVRDRPHLGDRPGHVEAERWGAPADAEGDDGAWRGGQGNRGGGRPRRRQRSGTSCRRAARELTCSGLARDARRLLFPLSTPCLPAPRLTAGCTCRNGSIRCLPASSNRSVRPTWSTSAHGSARTCCVTRLPSTPCVR